jgi:hypothetical protein
MTDKKIAELTQRLKELNIQQAKVIEELETLTKSTEEKRPKFETERDTKETVDGAGKILRIGDKVQITNKGRFRETRGTITKIGILVSIRLNTGQTTTRKSTNLLRQDA